MMDQLITATPTLFSTVHPDLEKRTSVSSVIGSGIIALLGIGAFLGATKQPDTTSSTTILLITAGTILLLLAIFRLVWKSKEWVYIPTGSVTREGSCFFDDASRKALEERLAHQSLGKGKQVAVRPTGNVRLDYMISDDGRFVAAQLLAFVPYTFEPVSAVCYLDGEHAKAFAACLKTNRF